MIGMITMTIYSCSNDSMETTKSEPQQKSVANKTFARSADGTTKEEQAAIDILQGGMSGRIYQGGTSAYIDCHTNYNDDWGNACVWSNGYLFNVSWTTVYSPGYFGGPRVGNTHYVATQTSFCHC